MSVRDSHWDENVSHPISSKLEPWGKKLFMELVSWLIPRPVPPPFSFDKVHKILLIKTPYRMGDLLQITPLLKTLKKLFPEKHLGLVIQDRNLPVFQYNANIDQLFVFYKRETNRFPWKFFSLMKQIRGAKYDCAVTLETQRTHLINDLIAAFSGASYRLRYDGKFFNGEKSNIFYNILLPMDRSLEHEVDKNFGIFKSFQLGLGDRRLELNVSDKELEIAKKILSNFNAPPVLIHPGAYKLNNRWPLARYLAVGQALQQEGKNVLFILGPSEIEWKESIEKEGFMVASGQSILEAAALFSLAGATLCNDTGVMHLSAAVGAKTFALFGATDPAQWKPPGDHVVYLQARDKNVSSIQVEEVLNLLRSFR